MWVHDSNDEEEELARGLALPPLAPASSQNAGSLPVSFPSRPAPLGNLIDLGCFFEAQSFLINL